MRKIAQLFSNLILPVSLSQKDNQCLSSQDSLNRETQEPVELIFTMNVDLPIKLSLTWALQEFLFTLPQRLISRINLITLYLKHEIYGF